MNNTEKAAYIKGLIEGLGIDDSTKEGKVLLAISELLSDMSNDLDDVAEVLGDVEGQVDEIDEDLSDVEELVYSAFDDEDFDWDDDEDDDDDFDEWDDEDEYFEVTCPDCGDKIELSGSMLDEGTLECPNCGTIMEFDLDNIQDATDDAEDEEEE